MGCSIGALKTAAHVVSLAALVLGATVLPVAAQSETVEYYGLDALGSVRVIFNAQGGVIDRMDYGPFGENLRAAIKFPVEQFAQLARDAESGQDYAEARNYSAGTGRFNRVDPVYSGLFEPQRWNRYAYALNKPLGFVDPEGLQAQALLKCTYTWTDTSSSLDCREWWNFDFGGGGGSGSGSGLGTAGIGASEPQGGFGGRGIGPPPPPTLPSPWPTPTPPTPTPPAPTPTPPAPTPPPFESPRSVGSRVKSIGGILGGWAVGRLAESLPCGKPRAAVHAVAAGLELGGTVHAVGASVSAAAVAVTTAPTVGASIGAGGVSLFFAGLTYSGAQQTVREIGEVNRNLHCN